LMKRRQTVITRDYKFIAFAIIAITIVIGLSFIIPSEINYENKDLPERYDGNYTGVVISEIMTNNNGVYVNENNECVDYIEIYNATTSDVDISGYGLSDKEDEIKWTFPNGTVIEAGKYLVVSCDGGNKGDLSTNFKLSSLNSERVIFTNKSSKIIDAVDTVALDKNNCMNRDEDGQWYISSYGTPGFENSQLGLQLYISSIQDYRDDELVINEFFPRNNGNFINEYDQTAGYIEFINASDHTINLADYYISNSIDVPFKKQLDEVFLASNEIYYLYIGNGDYQRTNYIGFNFDSNSGNVIISKNGKIIQNIEYDNLNSGEGYTLLNGRYYISAICSMGYPNDAIGIEQFQKKYLANRDGLIINEVMNYNRWYLPQNGAQYYDWIELYNNSDETINLSNYCLSTNQSRLDYYCLPDYELQPHEYYVLMCSENEQLTNQTYVHTNFKLSSEESIFLSYNGKIIDSMYISNVPNGYSYGRDSSSGYFYIGSPTPLASNKSGTRSISLEPIISIDGGIYDDVSKLEIEITAPGTIYYTLDGNIPTTNSNVYNGPIVLNRTTVIKAICVCDGQLNSEMVCNSYIINENHTLPVVSLSLSTSNFSFLQNNAWTERELQAYIEFFEDDGYFESNCGICYSGATSRNMEAKCYNISFDNQWGASNVTYPIFDKVDNSVYDAITLRSGSTDHTASMVRDILSSRLVEDFTDLDVKSSKIVILYINGKYWGIYSIREKINAQYVSENHNVDKESVNLLHVYGNIYNGTNTWYQQLRSYVRSHDLSTDEAWQYLSERINMESLADEFIAEMFTANPDLANIKFYNSEQYDDGRLHYIFYDTDRAFSSVYFNYYTYYLDNYSGFPNAEIHNGEFMWVYYENTLIHYLINYCPNFQKVWLERLAYNLNNTFSAENINKYLDEIVAIYLPEINRDRQRWGLSVSSWNAYIRSIRYFSNNRGQIVLNQTKSFFDLTDKEMKDYFGDLW